MKRGARLSRGSDSGNTKEPYTPFNRQSAPATQNGSRGSNCPHKPPIAGPMTNPRPNAAPSIPKAFARSCGGETSATYAPAAVALAEVMPEITRPASSHQSAGASAMTK